MRSQLCNRPQFCVTAHVRAGNPPAPHSRSPRHNFQFRRAHFNFPKNARSKTPRHHPCQRPQSPGHQKHAMTLRSVPNNPPQRFVEERQGTPAKKFRPERSLPLAHPLFADSPEIPFVSLRSAVQIAPETSSKPRKPPSHTPARNFIALQQISNEPPLQRRRGQQRAIHIKKYAHVFRTHLRQRHRIPEITAARRAGSFRSAATAPKYRPRHPMQSPPRSTPRPPSPPPEHPQKT